MKKPIVYKSIVRPLIILYIKIFINPKILGLENIPEKSGAILAGNHTNNLDSVLLVGINQRVIHFLAKDELLKGWKKILFKNMAIIPVNRSIHDKQALNEAITLLNKKELIGIFPEGTINRTEEIILPFKIGAVKMASETSSPIIPFIITGNYKKRNNLCIEFLPPIEIPKVKDLTKYNEKLMGIIKNKLKEKRKAYESTRNEIF